MRQPSKIKHEFVEFIPKTRVAGVIYVSIPYSTAVHNCFCGCGAKVVTPISPTGWQLVYDGESVSFFPSIGNWGFACRSHYWIKRDLVVWGGDMTQEEIEQGRERDRALRDVHFGDSRSHGAKQATEELRSARKTWLDWLFGRGR